jgi:predicted Rossmann fold nucleotide-binding protein DprA/Smf involved in DNA uptake
MIEGYDICEIESPIRLQSFFERKPAKLWCVGDPTMLNRTLVGIISARQIDSDLPLKTLQLLKQLALLKEACFISGWHSPLEQEALRIIVAQGASIIFCVAKSLNRFVPPVEIKHRVSQGGALLLTHCSPKAKRISREASIRRNELIVGLAKVLLVLSAPDGSASLKLANSALRRGRSVLTIEHRMNNELLAAGAVSATLENIQTALG